MSQEKQNKPKTETEETVEETEAAEVETTIDDQEIDDMLNEIDDVLEENAETFLSQYVQKGGE